MRHVEFHSKRSLSEIETWLTDQIATKARADRRLIDPQQPFSSFGIDSVRAVSLVGEMEEWIGRELSPTLLYDYPTIDTLAKHLANEVSQLF